MPLHGRPWFVNVFLGRLNSFVSSNELGSGDMVGEKATLASQTAVREIRKRYGVETRQIGASLRNGQQILDLAGLDVLTMPPKAAQEFLAYNPRPDDITDRTDRLYSAGVNANVDMTKTRLNTLWHISPELVDCVDQLENEDLDSFTPDDLIGFFEEHGCGDVLVRWSDEEREVSTVEGKIPRLANWEEKLASGAIGLDSLMNLAGLCSFAKDQKAMDETVEGFYDTPVHHVIEADRQGWQPKDPEQRASTAGEIDAAAFYSWERSGSSAIFHDFLRGVCKLCFTAVGKHRQVR